MELCLVRICRSSLKWGAGGNNKSEGGKNHCWGILKQKLSAQSNAVCRSHFFCLFEFEWWSSVVGKCQTASFGAGKVWVGNVGPSRQLDLWEQPPVGCSFALGQLSVSGFGVMLDEGRGFLL